MVPGLTFGTLTGLQENGATVGLEWGNGGNWIPIPVWTLAL
jgi:hypothetical protein